MSWKYPGLGALSAALFLKHWDRSVSLGVEKPRWENLATKNGRVGGRGCRTGKAGKKPKGARKGTQRALMGITGERNGTDTERRQAAGTAP